MDVPDGDFEAVVKLSAPVALDYQSAGLLAWQDWDNYVRTGPAHVGSAGGPVIETATEVGAAFTSTFAPRPGSTAEIVKLARTGDVFVSSYWDGAAWSEAARTTARLTVGQVGLFGLSAQNGTSMRATFDYFAIKAPEGERVVPEGTFTLRARALPYLSAERSGAVGASAKAPMAALAFTAEPAGDGVRLKDAATGRYLHASDGSDRVRLSSAASVFELVDAGGGTVTLSSGGRNVSISDGRLVMGAEADKFRVEGYTSGRLTVDTRAAGTKVGPHLYGVFYEDINHAADGGLYAELVRNRSFEFNAVDFADAIRAEHPDIKIISNSGQTSQGAWFDRMWQFARDQKADLVDEHYYNNPNWFLTNNRRYDSYDREGPKVFVGEYASQGNTFFNALAEASYMTGLERNSDVVELASYAPLMANVDYVDWTPDLIWFDNDEAYGSPSYHVQRLFSTNVGERVVPSTFEGEAGPVEDITGAVGLGSWNTAVRYDDVKVTAADGTVLLADDFSSGAGDWTPGLGSWAVQDGAYVQTAQIADARSTAGSPGWSNYTIEVTARKTGGAEGFLVMFGVRDTGTFYWWNVGGWNNTQSAVEKAVNGGKSSIATSSRTVQTGRDYRLKIQVDGRRITTWLDGEQVDSVVDDSRVEPLYQVVSRDGKSVTLKVVNAQDTAVRANVDLGRARVRPAAMVTSLTGSPSDTNSLSDPDRVSPVRHHQTGFSSTFTYDFPAHSVTVIPLTER
ncbi:alpha-L-arabinofuranosidase C-terminal domain-containing protein [Nonomuraea aridisoli]|uniref:non-reducing end alpha-L-arabinofuranosidase n=1 Tax=Nonomuraea aridisoli TaxID=2070368 RepID=A0A2W2E3V5_9ACTN|nr:alpha-L-arabinofuranosidase C-terminal domain-containing protein [Nonomuraea aridisoli]PZG11289.1 hypothetical protein C1J01_35160 [Nonomuraea aridisoli]